MPHLSRTLAALGVALLGGSLCLAATPSLSIEFAEEPPPSPLPVNRMALAGRLSKAPRIDGRIEPEVWEQATTLAPLSRTETADPAPVATEVRVGCTEDFLFIALACDEPEAERMVGPSATPRDQRIWATDSVEFLFDSINDRRRPKGVVIGPAGGLADFEIVNGQRNLDWDSGVVAAVARTERGWSAELSLPRKRFDDPANGVVGFNVIRRRLGAVGAPYTWNPCPPQHVESGEWMGSLAFDTPPVAVQQVRIGWPHVGRNRLQVRLRNDTRREQRVRIGVATGLGARAPDFSRYKVVVPPSQTVELELTHSIRDAGPHDFEFLLIDDATGRRITWFARRDVPVNESAVQVEGPGPVREGQLGVVFRVMLPADELRSAVVRAAVREAGGLVALAEAVKPLDGRIGRVLLVGDVAGKELTVTIVRKEEMLGRGVILLHVEQALEQKREEGE